MRLLGLLALAGCVGGVDHVESAADARASAPTTVTFDGRTIDLAVHLEGFPYSVALAVPEHGLLFYDHTGPTQRLLRASMRREVPPDLAAGTPVGAIDWSTRSRWELRYHAPSDSLYYAGDERNDEAINLWRLALGDGSATQLTSEGYVYGWSFDPTERRVALISRNDRPDGEGFLSCLETMAADGTDRRKLACDSPAATFTWSDPSWSPDGERLVVRVNKGGRRDRANLAVIEAGRPEIRLLTDPGRERTTAEAAERWLDADRFVYLSDETGYDQVYAYDLRTGASEQLTRFDRDMYGLAVMEPVQGTKLLVAVLHRPDEDVLVVLAPDGTEISRHVVDGSVGIAGSDDRTTLVLQTDSARSPFQLWWARLGEDGSLAVEPWLGLPEPLEEKLVRCDVEKVSVPTFDTDPATGATRELHAYLYRPKEPPPADRALARVLSFYGGTNAFDTGTQVFCDAGIATLSPAVRGSSGFGTAFYRLNDGDLGGDEIVDVFEAGRWLEAQGFARGNVGVYGRSHGGYATMRALTFPPGTNGHGEDAIYPFGFGLADAGFSDILTFYAASNIPDWVVLEAGDPATEADELRDRSPLSHVDRLRAPLLLTHGENDNRVPVEESRQFAEACAAAGKPCTYVEFADQGHRVRGLDNERRLYQARFAFLEGVLDDD